MGGKTRKTGIDILGDAPWGTHFCQFYHTKEDLIDILVPYFKAGLENNEFCMWITSEPLSEREAKEVMREALPDLDRYLKRGQIEILPHEEWYLKEGAFNTQRVLKGWVDKLDQALAQDYDGLRLTGNTFWLEKKDWRNFTEYEKEVNNVIGKYRMMAICSYSLDKCGASEVIDVVSNHQFALIRKEGKWATIESSERKQAEEQLGQSRDYLERLTNSMWDAIFSVKMPERVIEWANDSFKLIGYAPEECIGKTTEFLYPSNSEFVDFGNKLKNAIAAGKDILHAEQLLKGKSGEVFSAEITTTIFRENGEVAHVTSIIRDITERKQAEEELREKEEFNFALFQHNPIQTMVVDRGGRVLKVNMAKRKSGDRLPNIGDVIYKDYATKHEIDMHAELRECINSDKAKRFPELKYGDKFLNIMIAPFPQGAIITSLDITERKQAEEEKDKLLKTIETTKEAINITTPDAIMKYTNDAMDELFGYKKGELIGKHVSVLNAGPSRKAKKTPAHITDTIKKKGVWEGEIHNKRKDGTEFISLAKISALIDKTGKIINYVSSQHDITESKKAEEEIKNSQSQLRNLTAHLQSVREEERTLIAREMHDELGQALTAMKMDLSWLDNRLPKDQKSLLEKTKSMSKLADATLQTVKKISTELRPGLLDDLGLPAAIEWQAEEFQTRTGIKCEITVDPEDIILDKDRSTAIFRIFQETLTNVARHAKATKVKVSLKEKAGKIELKVRDNGKGITEKQVSDPKSFGLIGIKERAYYLDGKVVIKGLQDKGTTLTIRIPLPKKGKAK